jgi:hypothetical protein
MQKIKKPITIIYTERHDSKNGGCSEIGVFWLILSIFYKYNEHYLGKIDRFVQKLKNKL